MLTEAASFKEREGRESISIASSHSTPFVPFEQEVPLVPIRHFLYDSPVHWFSIPPCTVEIPRPSRSCAVSHRDFLPNEMFFSVLTGEDGQFVRQDIAAEHWTGQPEECFGWWKSTVKHVTENASQQVSGETLQSLFERLIAQPGEPDTLYILALLLLRRKLLRYEKETTDAQGNRLLEVYAIQTSTTYQIPVEMPGHERLEAIQQQLATLTNV